MKEEMEEKGQQTQKEFDNILEEACYIVNCQNHGDYPDPVKNFRQISEVASAWSGRELSPLDCVNVMIAVKECRERYRHKRDNMVDLAGYFMIREKILECDKNAMDLYNCMQNSIIKTDVY